MQSDKVLEFHGKAGGYFVVAIVTWIMTYIPFLGWAFAFNYAADWMVDNTTVRGKKLAYKAGYGETLGFVAVNFLLIIVTLGIYSFWFVPKSYRYVMDHVSEAGDMPAAPAAPAAPEAPAPADKPADSTTPPAVQG
ncbi:DUF898 family protein [Candidatus Saccharibacteria bacterium]|nr:DUF898 family protein [Candidatus Saccharibacteria bacterium]